MFSATFLIFLSFFSSFRISTPLFFALLPSLSQFPIASRYRTQKKKKKKKKSNNTSNNKKKTIISNPICHMLL